jgi:Shedu protein SduA, C-terminal
MAKTINIISGKGFKYTGEENLLENSQTKITMQCKHVPNQQTGEFHHLELHINKYSKSRSQNWQEVTSPSSTIVLSTKDKNNTVTENSIKELFQILEAQREIIFKNLTTYSTIVIDEKTKIEAIKALDQDDLLNVASELSNITNKELTFKALKLISDKSEIEISELIKLGFTPNKIAEKKKKIEEFKNLVNNTKVKEVKDIQYKLAEIPWIFGPEYIKLDKRDAGSEGLPDGRLKRIDGLSDILEVKLPNAELLRKDKIGRTFIAPQLAEALGQLTGYLEHYNNNYLILKDDETGEEIGEEFFGNYYKPKGILLIGRRFKKDGTISVSNTVDAIPKVLRKVISYFHWLEVLTYDDLIERAENSINKLSK